MMDARLTDESKSDADLLADVAQGDEAALRLLYERHVRWLARRLRARLSVEATEDVLQETFFAAWKGATRYQGDGDVAAWLWGIARRQSALWARRHGRDDLALAIIGDLTAATDDPARSAVVGTDLHHALASLGPDARRLGLLALLEDRPIGEIARTLDIPAGTVKSRLYHLRRRLSAALGKEHRP